MEGLIKQALMHADVIGPHVQEGHYDLIGPNGEIILPAVWDKVIEPGWSITMTMWPIDKVPLANGSLYHPPPPTEVPPLGRRGPSARRRSARMERRGDLPPPKEVGNKNDLQRDTHSDTHINPTAGGCLSE